MKKLGLIVTAAFVLTTGCTQSDQTRARQNTDRAGDKIEQESKEAWKDTKDAARKAGDKMESWADKAADETKEAGRDVKRGAKKAGRSSIAQIGSAAKRVSHRARPAIIRTMLRRNFLSFLAAPALAQSSAPSDTTTAVALGDGRAKYLMIHADDAGMCHSVNLASMEALLSRAVSSASIMMPCPWVSEIAEFARQHPELDLGLHLTLTSEWRHYRWRPVIPADRVKGLIDEDGYMHRDVRSVAMRASAAEVETELRAQIELAHRCGIQFTHVDTHMGTLYARSDYFEVYTKVARDAKVPCMIPRPTAAAAAELRAYPVTAADLERKEAEGFVLLDRLVTGVPGGKVEERFASYRKFLRDLQPGVTKLIVHLAKDDSEIRAVTGNWEQRWADFRFFTSEEARSLMAELGIRPVTYRELGKLAYRA